MKSVQFLVVLFDIIHLFSVFRDSTLKEMHVIVGSLVVKGKLHFLHAVRASHRLIIFLEQHIIVKLDSLFMYSSFPSEFDSAQKWLRALFEYLDCTITNPNSFTM